MDSTIVIWTLLPILIITLVLVLIYRCTRMVQRRFGIGATVDIDTRRKWAINGLVLVAAGPAAILFVCMFLAYPRVTEALNYPSGYIPLAIVVSCIASITGIRKGNKHLALIAGTVPALAVCLAIPLGTIIGLTCLSNLYNRDLLKYGFSNEADADEEEELREGVVSND